MDMHLPLFLVAKLSQLRRQLPPFALGFICSFAVRLLPEEQPVNQLAWPVTHAVTVQTVRPRRERFIRPAIEQGIEKLVQRNGDALAVAVVTRHQASPSDRLYTGWIADTASFVSHRSSWSS